MFISMMSTTLIGFIFLFFIYKLSIKYEVLIDIPKKRSVHTKPIPMIGGLFIFFSFIFEMYKNSNEFYSIPFYVLFISSLIVFIGGLIDDLKDVSPKLKFVFIILASTVVVLNGLLIDNIRITNEIYLNLWIFSIPFTIFAITGLTNALNLLDGIDGYASSVAIVLFIAFYYIGTEYNDDFLIFISTIMIVFISLFFLLNFPPAKIFLGDNGSLFIGFMLSILSIYLLKYLSEGTVLLMLTLPVMDTFTVIFLRLKMGKSPFEADKIHLHHVLLNITNSAKITLLLLITLHALFVYIAINLEAASYIKAGIFFIIFLWQYILRYYYTINMKNIA